MVRSTTSSAVLILMVAFAGPGRAADTGMLYVKSFPSGATVVIEGKERGKTPVLVRDLPAGDVTVELRVAGVKPVTKQATVKANKVVTIDVAIEVPSATLTIVSEPLEATVILDGREVGKTPLTLERLDPGEHSLLLLKDGCPRTARSVVLEPGSERVLEVKLGTAGGEEANDETERRAAGEPVAKAAKSVPLEVQLIFTMLKDTVDKGNYSETRRNLALALSQPDMANFKVELCAAIRVVQALEMRQRHIRKGAEALVGREVTLGTKTGPRSGKVEGVSFEGITLATKIMVEGAAAGETRATIEWAALAPGEQDRLAESWKPEGLDGAVARAILAQAGNDKAAAERAATTAGDNPLGKYLMAKAAAARPGSPEAAWDAIALKVKASRMSSASTKKLLEEIAAFKARYGSGGLEASLLTRIAETESHLRRARAKAMRIPPGAVEFGGHSYKLFREKVSWKVAKSFCDRARGHLVTLTSFEENQFVINMCRGRASVVWIGLTDSYREGHWQWITGEKFDFRLWGQGEPNNAGNEDFGELRLVVPDARHKEGRWNDGGLKGRAFFICEWEAAAGAAKTSPSAGARPRE